MWASLVAQTVKRLSTMRETRVRSLGWENPLEKEMAIHSSRISKFLTIQAREGNGNPLQYSCLENPMDGGPWWAAVHGVTIESVMPSNHLILYLPCLLLPSIFPSIRIFTNESVLHVRWPKY